MKMKLLVWRRGKSCNKKEEEEDEGAAMVMGKIL